MKNLFVGLDVSKDDFKAAVKDEQNNLVMQPKNYGHDRSGLESLDSDLETLKDQFKCGAIFGMEATGIYHLSIYQHLIDRREHVKVFNGLELKRFKGRIRKTKTDNLDALAIAEALLLAREPSYHPSDRPELIQMRELCRLRDRLVKKASRCKIQATRDMDILCRGYTDLFDDIFSPSSIAVIKTSVRTTRLFKPKVEDLVGILNRFMSRSGSEKKALKLSTLFKNTVVPEHMREICILEIHMLIQQYEVLKQQLERVESRIEHCIEKIDPWMISVPGIGPLTAGVILGELGDLCRFNSTDQLTAYSGLDPTVMESGRSRRTGHISKRGSTILRETLYNAAFAAIRVNPVCKQFYQRLKAKGKHHKVCLVAVANKLLHIAYSVEKNQRDFYVPSYITENGIQ
jgi:transposase